MGKRGPRLNRRVRDCQMRPGRLVSKGRMAVQGLEQLQRLWGDGLEGGGKGEEAGPTVGWKMRR